MFRDRPKGTFGEDWTNHPPEAADPSWPPEEGDWTLRKLLVRTVAALLLLSLVATLAVAWRGAWDILAIGAVLTVAVVAAKLSRRGSGRRGDDEVPPGPSGCH
ncbi:MAG: hypothetical protein OXN89_25790 [Bryobacterales bacterium]|nr:hypothetical protein [Bryobacterales bacterium]